MIKQRANLSGLIGPRNSSSIMTFVRCSKTNAKLVEIKREGVPYLYTLSFDYLQKHELREQGRILEIYYDYGGTHFIGLSVGDPYNFIYRTTRKPEEPRWYEGRSISFRPTGRDGATFTYEAVVSEPPSAR